MTTSIIFLTLFNLLAFWLCYTAHLAGIPRARFYTTVTLLCWLFGILYLLTLSWKTIHP